MDNLKDKFIVINRLINNNTTIDLGIYQFTGRRRSYNNGFAHELRNAYDNRQPNGLIEEKDIDTEDVYSNFSEAQEGVICNSLDTPSNEGGNSLSGSLYDTNPGMSGDRIPDNVTDQNNFIFDEIDKIKHMLLITNDINNNAINQCMQMLETINKLQSLLSNKTNKNNNGRGI